MGKDIESPCLYDYYGNSINSVQVFDDQNIFMCENPSIKQFYCAFENNLPKEKVVEFNNVHVQEINNFPISTETFTGYFFSFSIEDADIKLILSKLFCKLLLFTLILVSQLLGITDL